MICALVVAMTVITANAQTGTSTVRGTITDAQGQVVAGATITIRNEAKNFSRSTTSDSKGAYIITALPPSDYSIEVEAQGFKKAVSTNVKTLVDTASTFDISLEVGALSEVVTVTSGGEITVNTRMRRWERRSETSRSSSSRCRTAIRLRCLRCRPA